MACVSSSLYFHNTRSPLFRRYFSSPSLNSRGGTLKCRNQSVECTAKAVESEIKASFCVVEEEEHEKQTKGAKRRQVLLNIASASALALGALSFPSFALAEENGGKDDFRSYADEKNKFQIMIPQDWLVGLGQADGFKSVTAFYPQETTDSNVSIAITGIGADFTRLESFGKVDAFAESLVNGLDRSWQRPPGVAAKLIDAKAVNGLYYIEYSLQYPGESRRHIYSAIGMAFNGWYNRLYTVTGQYLDEQSENYKSKIEKCVSSFRFT
ncbi:hypothetical protein Sjap_009657 [Stephania japonica]|uniref:PsbP C-terminal domain-containing protein n=1 Tax=Stephania japonica TaxID=461633 RepID=A0AAP0J8Y0_9MAGN